MFDVSPAIAILILFGGLLFLLATGLHVGFALGGAGILVTILLWGSKALPIAVFGAWQLMQFYTLIAVPFFIFMALVLEGAGVANNLFQCIRLWTGGVAGGLAIGVVFICTILAAMSGIIATGVVTMGILALPIMLRLRYSKTMSIGPIMAGGVLGILIPPSVTFIILGALIQISIGRLFLAGLFPGLILSTLYVLYIGIRCRLKPELGPPIPPEERADFKEKLLSLKSIILPGALIATVLGTIALGLCSPTEAAGAGAVGAVVCAAINRKLNWAMIKRAVDGTFVATVFIGWILIGAFCFKATFFGIGGPAFVRDFVGGLDVPPLFIIFMMQLSYMLLGCFLEDVSMIMITVPVYLPIVIGLGFDPTWFCVLVVVNFQMASLSPPFGASLFYLKGVAPPEVTMGDIYRSVIPFIPLQFICLMLLLFFPQLALWLPELVFGLK